MNSSPEVGDHRLNDLRRSERSMVLVRWAAFVVAVVQVLAYRTLPYPPGVRTTGLVLAGLVGATNVAVWLLSRQTRTVKDARRLAIAVLVADILLASAFVWLYAFDPISALWAILFVLPLEGAIRFGLSGALWAWAAVTVLYIGREVWGSGRYDHPLEIESISFRMGIGLLIALVGGLMARNLNQGREQLAGTLARLSQTDALRARLVATLAHDVRNPLTTIRGALKILARHADDMDAATRDELLANADGQAERLERLAGDLLDLARLEGGRLELHTSNVSVAGVVARALSYADGDHRFETSIPGDLAVRADPARLEQVMVNLIANALRYGGEPFVVDAERRGKAVAVSFRDHGPGIEPGEQARLFEPFRVEESTGSVGLGLAIVKALIEAMSGSVSYEEERPSGACFRLTLPVARGI